jgi:hypothetical protein
MAARTCLLCGKSLGRRNEEFCSREHRNQYRLRQGMERLAEANQVASVMRRRESPRQIPPEQLRAEGDVARRECLEPIRIQARPPQLPQMAPPEPSLPANGEFLRPVSAGTAAPQILPGPGITIAARTAAPESAASLYAHVAPAPAVKPRPVATEVASRRRLAVPPKRKGASPALKQAPAAPPKVCFAGPRKVAPAVEGRALRVSLSAAFQLPEWKMRAAGSQPAAIAGMRWPELRALGGACPVSMDARACAIERGELPMRIPGAPEEVFESSFRWPGAMAVSTEFADIAAGHRTAFVPLSSEERR